MSYVSFRDVYGSLIRNHESLITDAVDESTGQLGFAWREDDSSSFLFMPFDLWIEDEEEVEAMAYIERKLETEIGRLNEELRKQARQVSSQHISN